MNILTDILSLIKRKKFVKKVNPKDVLIVGINEEPEIEGIASPVPYKDVKLIKIEDFIDAQNCDHVNVPIAATDYAGVFKNETVDDEGVCAVNLRRLKSLSLDLTIQENGDFIEFDIDVTDTGIVSIPNAQGKDIYYNSLQEAINAAVTGDTVYIHTNIIETTTEVVLKSGVNIDFNGFTYTLNAPGLENAFTDGGVNIKVKFIDGIIFRAGATAVGSDIDTTALYLSSESTFEAMNCQFYNDNGTAVSSAGPLLNVYAVGSETGIALTDRIELSNCTGIGAKWGIKQTNLPKFGYMINCKGYANEFADGELYAGITAIQVDVIDCYGENSFNYGLYLENCRVRNVTGYCTSGVGVLLLACDYAMTVRGMTENTFEVVTGYPRSGVVIHGGKHFQDVHGYSTGLSSTYPLYIQADVPNVISGMIIQNSSGIHDTGSSTGGRLYIDSTGLEGQEVQVILQNCSFSGGGIGFVVEASPTGSYPSLLNCSFQTTSNFGTALSGATPNTKVKYANCSFRTGFNNLGTPYDQIVQDIVNTTDNHGNIYI